VATDYDAPRTKPDDEPDSLESLTSAPRTDRQPGGLDDDDVVDLSGEELIVPLVPVQTDEFTCSSCFLVHHRSQISNKTGPPVCRDCAS
jgi:hypothetical protein